MIIKKMMVVSSILFLSMLTACQKNTLTDENNVDAVNQFIKKHERMQSALCQHYFLGNAVKDGVFAASDKDCTNMAERLVRAAKQENKFQNVTVDDFKNVQVWKNYGEFVQKSLRKTDNS